MSPTLCPWYLWGPRTPRHGSVPGSLRLGWVRDTARAHRGPGTEMGLARSADQAQMESGGPCQSPHMSTCLSPGHGSSPKVPMAARGTLSNPQFLLTAVSSELPEWLHLLATPSGRPPCGPFSLLPSDRTPQAGRGLSTHKPGPQSRSPISGKGLLPQEPQPALHPTQNIPHKYLLRSK